MLVERGLADAAARGAARPPRGGPARRRRRLARAPEAVATRDEIAADAARPARRRTRATAGGGRDLLARAATWRRRSPIPLAAPARPAGAEPPGAARRKTRRPRGPPGWRRPSDAGRAPSCWRSGATWPATWPWRGWPRSTTSPAGAPSTTRGCWRSSGRRRRGCPRGRWRRSSRGSTGSPSRSPAMPDPELAIDVALLAWPRRRRGGGMSRSRCGRRAPRPGRGRRARPRPGRRVPDVRGRGP